jgi:hypothetical protein
MWLLELVNELQASVREGTLPRLSLSRIWVRNDGHLVLLDSPVFVSSSAVRAQEDLNPVRVLSLVAARGLSRNMEDGVPLTARSMIESWSGSMPPAIEDVRSSLMHVSSSLDRVHRWRRLVAVVFLLVPFLFGAGSLYFVRTEIARAMTPEKYEMVGLLNWLAFSSELLREPEFRIALERYLAARHAAALRDDQFWLGPAGLAHLTLRQTGLDIVARYPSVSPEELSQASAVVEPRLKDLQKELEMPVAEEIGLLLVFVTFFVVGWSLISSAIVPGGFVMRALGLALVTADGRAAGRARSVARTLVAWLPGIGWILWFMYCLGTGKTEAIGSWLAMVIAFLPLIAGAIWTIAYPSRGFHDRVAGTWVVPR